MLTVGSDRYDFYKILLVLSFWAFFFMDPDFLPNRTRETTNKSDPDPGKRTRGYETLNNLCESCEI